MNRLNHRLVAKLVCSVALLGLLVHFIPVRDVAAACTSINPALFATAVCLQFLTRGVAAWRLKIISDNQGLTLSRWALYRILLISQLYGLALPGSLAGGGITWLKYVQAGAPKDAAAATIVINKAVGVTFMVVFGGAAWLTDQAPGVASVIIVLAAVAALLIAFARSPGGIAPSRLAVASTLSWRNPLEAVRHRLWMFRDLPGTAKLMIALYSFAHELSAAAVMMGFAAALGLEVGLAQVLWVRAGLTLLLMLPVSVAGLGIREVSLVGLGGLIGIDAASAAAWSLVIFAGVLVVASVGGLLEFVGLNPRPSERPEDRP